MTRDPEDTGTNTVADAAAYECRRSLNAGEWDTRGVYDRDGREVTVDDWSDR